MSNCEIQGIQMRLSIRAQIRPCTSAIPCYGHLRNLETELCSELLISLGEVVEGRKEKSRYYGIEYGVNEEPLHGNSYTSINGMRTGPIVSDNWIPKPRSLSFFFFFFFNGCVHIFFDLKKLLQSSVALMSVTWNA